MKFLLLFLLTLPVFAQDINTLSPEEEADGWKLLFNGRDLEGWRAFGSDKDPGPGWMVKDGILVKQQGIPGGNIVTREKFENFYLVWEWRISEKGNNGIKYLVDENREGVPQAPNSNCLMTMATRMRKPDPSAKPPLSTISCHLPPTSCSNPLANGIVLASSSKENMSSIGSTAPLSSPMN